MPYDLPPPVRRACSCCGHSASTSGSGRVHPACQTSSCRRRTQNFPGQVPNADPIVLRLPGKHHLLCNRRRTPFGNGTLSGGVLQHPKRPRLQRWGTNMCDLGRRLSRLEIKSGETSRAVIVLGSQGLDSFVSRVQPGITVCILEGREVPFYKNSITCLKFALYRPINDKGRDIQLKRMNLFLTNKDDPN